MVKYIDMLETIYKYEALSNIKEEDRTVSYVPELKMYRLNKPLDNNGVKQMYFEIKSMSADNDQASESQTGMTAALEENIPEPSAPPAEEPEPVWVQASKKLRLQDSIIFVSKILDEGAEDSRYSYKNFANALKRYLNIRGRKAIGYIYEGTKYNVMECDGTKESSVMSSEECIIEFFHNYYKGILCGEIAREEEERIKREKEEAEARERAAELRINPKYEKEFKKMLKKESIQCLRDKDFGAYDFRGIDISGLVFVGCDFSNANFTDLAISDTAFIRCSMSGIAQEGTVYSNCIRIDCKG